jgi:hypothetical protein
MLEKIKSITLDTTYPLEPRIIFNDADGSPIAIEKVNPNEADKLYQKAVRKWSEYQRKKK